MKIRMNYVSNSSSSSFVCDVCGRTESGFDACLRDFDMVECEKGHVFCEHHRIDFTPSREDVRDYFVRYGNTDDELKDFLKDCNDENVDYESVYNLYEEYVSEEGSADMHCCPICMMKNLKSADGYAYLLKKMKANPSSLLNEIKTNFKNYDDFYNFIKK